MRLVIVIPTYNEVENIEKLCKEILKITRGLGRWETHLLVVDSYSSDGTTRICKRLSAEYPNVHLSLVGRGVGTALRLGFDYAFDRLDADAVLQIDADLSHSPGDIPRLLERLVNGVDLVIGSRFVSGGENRLGPRRRILSTIANHLVRLLLGIHQITEWTTNFRVFTRDLYKKIDPAKLNYSDNTFLPAFIFEALGAGSRVLEVPIIFKDRERGQSKINVPKYIPNLSCYLVKKFWRRLFSFFGKREVIALLIILSTAGFFRFYNIDKATWFAGDEGRDALAISKIIETRKPLLQGPPTSVRTDSGRVYYGPGFYYLVLPAFVLFRGHPASGAIVVATLGVLSTLLIFLLTQDLVGKAAALFASALYSVSPLVVGIDRHFWSPNVIPFFVLLIFYSFYQMIVRKRQGYLILIGVSLAMVWQLHYTSVFILLPLAFLWWCFKPKVGPRVWTVAISAFALISSPLPISEMRHGFPNFKTLIYYFTQQEKPSLAILQKIRTVGGITLDLFLNSVTSRFNIVAGLLLGAGLIILLLRPKKSKPSKEKVASFFILSWLVFPLIPHFAYSGEFAFEKRFVIYLLPLPFILAGITLDALWRSKNKIWRLVGISTFSFLAVSHLLALGVSPHKVLFPPESGLSLYNRERAANFMIKESKDKRFNFIIKGDEYYSNAYLYLLKYRGAEVSPEPQVVYCIYDPIINEGGGNLDVVFGEIGVEKLRNN